MASLAMLPQVMAQRDVGTTFTLTSTVMDSCHEHNGSVFRIVYCADDVPEIMHYGSELDNRNFFYWLMNPYPSAGPLPGSCLITLTGIEGRNYTYSINHRIAYNFTGDVDDFTFLIRGNKYTINKSGSSAGEFVEDFIFNDNYTIFAEATGVGTQCNTTVVFTIDRSEFEDSKPALAILMIISLAGVGAYTLYFSKSLTPALQVLTRSMSFLFVYGAFAMTLLVEREYIKLETMNTGLDNLFTVTAYSAYLISSIAIFMFIINSIKKASEAKDGE